MTAITDGSRGGFEPYTGDVYGWAYRLLGRHHDALDVVQDVFLRWDAQCAEQTPRQPRGWLRRVTLNRAIDLRRQRQPASEPQAAPLYAERQGSACEVSRAGTDAFLALADTRIDRETLRDDIAAALDHLSDVQRGVLVAKVYDELTFAQIAEELDLAVSTIKTHYLRAVRAVRDRLQRRWGREGSS